MKTFLTVLMLAVLFSVRGYAEDQSGAQAQAKGVAIKGGAMKGVAINKGFEHAGPAVPKIGQAVPQALPKVPRPIPMPPKVTQPFAGGTKLPPGLAKRGELPAGIARKGKMPEGWEKGQKKGWIEKGVTEENLEMAKPKPALDKAIVGESSSYERSGNLKKEMVAKVKKEKGKKKK